MRKLVSKAITDTEKLNRFARNSCCLNDSSWSVRVNVKGNVPSVTVARDRPHESNRFDERAVGSPCATLLPLVL